MTKMSKNLRAQFEKLATSKVHPNYYYAGVGRWTTKSPDYAARLIATLQGLGMVDGRHFEHGNDSKLGGHTGAWVKLTALGRRRKVFRDMRAKAEGVTV
jgi:hypothetical protein